MKRETINKTHLTLMCGISNSGKSSYVKEHYKQSDSLVIISRDALVLEYAHSSNYAKAWASLSSDEHKKIDRAIEKQFKEAIATNKEIVVDMMNLSRKARNRWLKQLPSHYSSSIKLFIVPMTLIKRRNTSAEGKHILETVLDAMQERFEYPLDDEVDRVELIESK